MGFFTLKSKRALEELSIGDKINESCFATLDDKGKFYQFDYVEEEEPVETYKVKPGIFTIFKTMAGCQLGPTEFTKNKILEQFVQTKEIEDKVDCFFRKLDVYKKLGIEVPKRSALLYGKPGCHAQGTKILMFDGSLKNVEDVKVGDKLMGPDSSPREVLGLAKGRQEMVKIKPIKGEAFTVNKDHILHLTYSGNRLDDKVIDIKFSDWLEIEETKKRRYKLTRTGVVFQNKKDLPLDPYIFGTWLGDGHSHMPAITNVDKIILNEWENYVPTLGLKFIQISDGITYAASSGRCQTGEKKNGRNKFLTILQELEVINNKHIPQIYKTSSVSSRLQLLAGIIDTDGSLSCNGYDYISKVKKLAEDVMFLSRSLGFAAYVTECQKGCQTGAVGTYYRVSITGNTMVIPVKVPHKKASPRKQIKSVLRTGFTYEILPEDNYYGFALDKDHLYLTSDFTIHHNTGKTSAITKVCNKYNKLGNTAIVIWSTNAIEPYDVKEFIKTFEYVGVNNLILVAEDVGGVEVEQRRVASDPSLLSLLDNQEKSFKIPTFILATTNHPEMFLENLAQRPDRFDDKIEVGFPTKEARVELLNFFTLDKPTEAELGYLSSNDCKRFSPAHIREVVIRSAIYEKTMLEVMKELKKEMDAYDVGFAETRSTGIGMNAYD